jgi:DNA polymerase III delta prime subunit
MLSIHNNIHKKLNYFIEHNSIPNIVFHGPSGSGKRTIIQQFLKNIYGNDNKLIDAYVMYVNCAHGKGIRFVREDLKFFARTHINVNKTGYIKTIILSNADDLTIDAQSALRRCIELFSHTTRFFLVVENKCKLIKPIISRFCDIYIPLPIINKNQINLHTYNLDKSFKNKKSQSIKAWLKHNIETCTSSYTALLDLSKKIYERGYSGLDIINYIETSSLIQSPKKEHMLLMFEHMRSEFRNETLFIFFMLNFIIIRSDSDLENITLI